MVPWYQEHSWELMSVHDGSWLHGAMFKNAHERSRVLLSVHECSVVLRNVQECPRAHGNTLMSAYGCSWALISTYKQQRALMGMAQWRQQYSWELMSIHELGAMAPLTLIVRWHHTYQCSWVLMSAHGGSWVVLSIPEWAWVFKFLIHW